MQKYSARLHIMFWVAYFAYDVFLQASYMQHFLTGIPFGARLWMSMQASLIVLPVKMLVTYTALHFFIQWIRRDGRKMVLPITAVMTATVAGVLLYRYLHYAYVDPHVYEGRENRVDFFAFIALWKACFEIWSVAGVALIIKFVGVQFKSREKEKALMKEKLETELKFLRNQTNPHFLFNTLNNIYALALKKSDETPGVVTRLYEILDFMLYGTRKEMITIGDELKIIDDYIALEKIRCGNRLAVTVTRDVDNDKEPVAPLLLLSFVENAFKHGVSESRFESFIHIDVKIKNGILHFNIENTKEEWDKPSAPGNIGLVNARRQLEILYKDHKLAVADEKKYFKVDLTINLHSHATI